MSKYFDIILDIIFLIDISYYYTYFRYDVRLMQEGRMKGQAFVTLQNIVQAQMALDETHGYILKDKPMVVQFGKAVKS